MRRYSDSPSYRDGQFRWSPHYSVSHDMRRPIENPRNEGYRQFEEIPARRPYGATSRNSDFYPATRVIIMSNNLGQGMSPRLLRPPSHGLTPRFNGPETMQLPTETYRFNAPESMQVPAENDESKLTKQEQENAISKLRKEIYNPTPKILERRVSLYYRDLNRNPNINAAENHKDEDSKSCAVCLEDFEAREEVMLTPCSHMFHEECIVPWVKNHGQCPVCRASFCERRQNALPFNNNNNVNYNNNSSTFYNNNNRRMLDQPAARRVLLADELLSLIQAVDEAFPWRR